MHAVRLILAAALLIAPLCIIEAEESEAPRFSDAEIELAEKVAASLTADQQLLINGLRYLTRPAYEEEMMQGRAFRPCALQPFEGVPDGPLDTLEMLRLWAVLQSGLPETSAIKAHVGRFFDTPVAPARDDFAPAGVAMALCLEISRRESLGRGEQARERAQALMDALMDMRELTDGKSELVQGKSIKARWFAGHLWRSLACRCALELEVRFNHRVWEKDIRNLNGAFDRKRGFSGNPNQVADVSRDLNANLIAMAALNLVLDAPDGAIAAALTRTVEKRVKQLPELLTRLESDYPVERTVGGRLLMCLSFSPDWSPERVSADQWRARILRHAAAYEPTGAVQDFHGLADELGLREVGNGRFHLIAMETSLSCLAVSGGLFRAGAYPLGKLSLPEIGRAMHAYSVLHAHRLPADSDGFGAAVRGTNEAIQRGCEWLESIQKSDGSFPGPCEMYSGNTAIALLAMLHGGWKRDSAPVRKGLEWILKYEPEKVKGGREVASVGYRNTYSDALVLMMLQKYYEPEQRAAGMFVASTHREFEQARKETWKSVDERHRNLIEWSLKNLDGSVSEKGGWGYYPSHVPYPSRMAGAHKDYTDNSCSQYVMLGYKAASLLGASFDSGLLKAEAERLIRDYWEFENLPAIEYRHGEKGRTGTYRIEKVHPGGWGYSLRSRHCSLQLTAAGISSLVVAMDELKIRGELTDDLAFRIGKTIHGAAAWMADEYYKPAEDGEVNAMSMENQLRMLAMDGWSIYYNLYSVERACELAGLRTLGEDVDWYQIGAQGLLNAQRLDGGWGGPKDAVKPTPYTVNASMAILFLKRASLPVITDPNRRAREKQPEPKPEPSSPITPGPGDKRKGESD
jgi:hypothetical protein